MAKKPHGSPAQKVPRAVPGYGLLCGHGLSLFVGGCRRSMGRFPCAHDIQKDSSVKGAVQNGWYQPLAEGSFGIYFARRTVLSSASPAIIISPANTLFAKTRFACRGEMCYSCSIEINRGRTWRVAASPRPYAGEASSHTAEFLRHTHYTDDNPEPSMAPLPCPIATDSGVLIDMTGGGD